MYWKGHCGIVLLVFAPLGFGLILLGLPTVALLIGGIMLWFAMLPDIDHRLPLIEHRGPTHSLLFAGLVGVAFGGVGYLLGDAALVGQLFTEDVAWADQTVRLQIAAFGFAVGVLAVLTHLLGDVLTPMGVNFLWPFSRKRYSLYLTRADNTLWNYGLLVAGVFATTAALYLASVLVVA